MNALLALMIVSISFVLLFTATPGNSPIDMHRPISPTHCRFTDVSLMTLSHFELISWDRQRHHRVVVVFIDVDRCKRRSRPPLLQSE
jgi:hypothetical protein